MTKINSDIKKTAVFQFGGPTEIVKEYLYIANDIHWYYFENDGSFNREEELQDLLEHYDLILEVHINEKNL